MNDHHPVNPYKKFAARALVAWMVSVFPIQQHLAYAQTVPQIPDGADGGAEAYMLNQRAKKLSEGAFVNQSPIRQIDLSPMTGPVRLPKEIPNPKDAELAQRAAERFPSLETKDLVEGAQRGSNFGGSIMRGADIENNSPTNARPDPGVSQTTSRKANVREVLPTYNDGEYNRLRALGGSLYSDPRKVKVEAEKNTRNLRRAGCRKTDFVLLERQNASQANAGAANRVLKVEFYDIEKKTVPNTSPVQYDYVYVKTKYKGGEVKLEFPTLGSVANQWWEKVSDQYAILYTYTPHNAAKERNYFTYNHRISVLSSGSLNVLDESYVSSYGTPSDGFKTVVNYQMNLNVDEVYVSADLYRTDVNYSEPLEGQSCNPDPPTECFVPSIGGDEIKWCGGYPGAGLIGMYDDTKNKSDQYQGKMYVDMMEANSTSRGDLITDGRLSGIIASGMNASADKMNELAGFCSRETLSETGVSFDNTYRQEDINICSESLINPYPNGCDSIKRSFGLSKLADHNFLTVRAYFKKKNPVMNPATGEQAKDAEGKLLWTYTKEPANVSGGIITGVPVFGSSQCPISNPARGGCSTESAEDVEETYYEYDHTPMPAGASEHVVNGVTILQGGTGAFSHYGSPDTGWIPSGSASGDGSYHQVRLMAEVHYVTINDFVGCKDYLDFAADKICTGAKLTCLETSPSRTVGSVTFGPGMATSGVLDILKKWGTRGSMIFDDYEDGDSADTSDGGAPLVLLNDMMCWEAKGEPFEKCNSMANEGEILTQFNKGQQIWATDCDISPEVNNSSCHKNDALSDCDSRFLGLFTGVCYNPTVAYDCGEVIPSSIDTTVTERADFCSGAIRCLGTECHRPNLTGANMADFAKAASGMEALDMAKMDMVCAETGEPPTTTTETCTPLVFGGRPSFCKIPVGSGIGITPNCCKDAKDAAKDVDADWMMYLKGTYLTYQISQNSLVQGVLQQSDLYNSTAKMFGEIAQPITDFFSSSSSYVTNNFVQPLSAGFDGIMKSFGMGGGATGGAAATAPAVDAAKEFAITGLIDELKKKLMQHAYNFLAENLGADFAQMIFQTAASETGEQVVTGELGALASGFALAIAIYAWARLIGHLIFKCKEEEFQWGIDEKMRLCSYAGSCCAKKSALLGCIEKRQLYCCYRSIAARVIAEQIIRNNLAGTTPLSYRSPRGGNGKPLKKCNINCGGFTAYELALVDWSRVDLSEWTDALIESGVLNTINPANDYGATETSLPLTKAVGRHPGDFPELDQNVPAVKTIEGMSQNIALIEEMPLTLRSVEHCYSNPSKMPYAYESCDEEDEEGGGSGGDGGDNYWDGNNNGGAGTGGSGSGTGGGSYESWNPWNPTTPLPTGECIESATLKCIYTGVGDVPGYSYSGNWTYPDNGNIIYAYGFRTPNTTEPVGGSGVATRATAATGKRVVLSKLAGDTSSDGKDNGCWSEGTEVASVSYVINDNKSPVRFCNLEPNTYYWVNVMPIQTPSGGAGCSGKTDCGYKFSLSSGAWTEDSEVENNGKPVIIVDQSGSDPAMTTLTIVPGCVNGGDVAWGSDCSTNPEYQTTYKGAPFTAKMTAGQILSVRYPTSGTNRQGGTGVMRIANPIGGGIGVNTKISLSPIAGDMNGNNVDRCTSQSTMTPSVTTVTQGGGFGCVIDRSKPMYYLNIEVMDNCSSCIFYISEESAEFK